MRRGACSPRRFCLGVSLGMSQQRAGSKVFCPHTVGQGGPFSPPSACVPCTFDFHVFSVFVGVVQMDTEELGARGSPTQMTVSTQLHYAWLKPDPCPPSRHLLLLRWLPRSEKGPAGFSSRNSGSSFTPSSGPLPSKASRDAATSVPRYTLVLAFPTSTLGHNIFLSPPLSVHSSPNSHDEPSETQFRSRHHLLLRAIRVSGFHLKSGPEVLALAQQQVLPFWPLHILTLPTSAPFRFPTKPCFSLCKLFPRLPWRLPARPSGFSLHSPSAESSLTPPPNLDQFPHFKNINLGASLVAQWLRIRLPTQGTRVRALVREDPTCHGATSPVRHNC